MTRAVRLLPALLLPLLASACASDPLAVAAENVDVSIYHVEPDTRLLHFTVRNLNLRTVHVAACDDHMVAVAQPRELWNVESANDFGVVCRGNVSSIPVAVQPGTSASGAVQAPGRGEYRVLLVLRVEADGDAERVIRSGGIVVP